MIHKTFLLDLPRPLSPVRHAGTALLFILALSFGGCGDHDHSHDLGGQHAADGQEGELEQVLIVGRTAEVFIEHTPLIAGKETAWRLHLTSESDGKPMNAGVVRLRVAHPGGQMEAIAKKQRSGVYDARFTVPGSGPMRVSVYISAAGIMDTVSVDGLQLAHDHAHAHEEPADDAIVFAKEEAWSMDFRVEPVRFMHFPTIVKTTGHLLSHPEMELEVPATASGVLVYRGTPLLPGQIVRAGQVLAAISGSGLSADNLAARIADAEALLEKEKADYARAKTLYAEQVISLDRLQEQTLEYERAKNAHNTLKANVENGAKLLRAPRSGYVKRIQIPNGAYVGEGTPVLTVARNDRLLLKAELYQSDYAQLSSIHSATFRTGDGRTLDIRDLNGVLRTRGQAVDESAYSIPLYFEIDGDELVSGEFVDVYLHAGEDVARLVIPSTALTEDLGKFYVYVQTGGERFEKREVEIHGGDGIHVPVLSGLEAGERIVTRGMHAIRLAASSGEVQLHAHEH